MAVYLTDTTRVRQLLGQATLSTDETAAIERIIAGVTAAMVREMGGRLIEAAARTVILDVEDGQKTVLLDAAPISAVASVRYDASREFATATEQDTTTYVVRLSNPNSARIYFPGGLAGGVGVLRITYTGGMAANLTALAADERFADLVDKATQQAMYEWTRRNNPAGGSLSGAGDVSVIYEDVKLLAGVRKTCRSHRLAQAYAS